jgi:hypothetical protein
VMSPLWSRTMSNNCGTESSNLTLSASHYLPTSADDCIALLSRSVTVARSRMLPPVLRTTLLCPARRAGRFAMSDFRYRPRNR